MNRRSTIYHWMKRFNTVAITAIILVFIGLFSYDQYKMWEYSQESGAKDDFGAAAAAQVIPFSGQEIRVPGGSFVSYYLAEDADSFEWKKGQNMTIVDLRSGSSHKVLGDRDPRTLISWELIEKKGKNPTMYVGYVAWAATKKQYDQGRADLLISAFPNMKQHILAKNIKYAFLPKVDGDENVAMVLWPEEDLANFVSFNLKTGEIIKKIAIDLPKPKKNFLSLNFGLPGNKFSRLHGKNEDAPVNKFSQNEFGIF